MISQDLLEVVKFNNDFKEFIGDNDNFEVFHKTLIQNEIDRLLVEYPGLFTLKNGDFKISTLTLIKSDSENKNYIKSNKIKFYINEVTHEILKVMISNKTSGEESIVKK